MDAAEIVAGLTPAPPTLERLEELVSCARQRARRADIRWDRAQAEKMDAAAALAAAIEDRDAWIAASPDPQLTML